MDRAGIRKLQKKVRHKTKPETIYAVRNHPIWNAANADQIRDEINRKTSDEKASAMGGDEDD
jgi:hypothetical protein